MKADVTFETNETRNGVAAYLEILAHEAELAMFFPRAFPDNSIYRSIFTTNASQADGFLVHELIADKCHVHFLWIRPDLRKQGFGRASLNSLSENHADRQLQCHVQPRHTVALRFLRGVGFKLTPAGDSDSAQPGLLLGTFEQKILTNWPGELKNFLDPQGKLAAVPSSKGKKTLVFQCIARELPLDRKFTEKEINAFLNDKHSFSDCATLRRELVVRGLLARSKDGSAYWVPS